MTSSTQLVIEIWEPKQSNVRRIQAVAAHICNLTDIAKETELYVQIKYNFLVNKYDEWDR
jgi:hypothetical protein